MTRHLYRLPVFLVAVVALILGAVTSEGWAQDTPIPWDEAEIFFELNNTDGDLGIHALIDGEAWKKLQIEDPNESEILSVKGKGSLGQQGLTELFFESAEPTFDELPPAEFFGRFPEGEYTIEGTTLEGDELESMAELTHVMPAPPAPTINGLPMAEQCDEEEPGFDATETSAPVTIAWPEVTTSHPDPDGGGAGVQPPTAVVIHNYEVVVEVQLEVGGEEFDSVFQVVLPPGETSMTIPAEFLSLGEEFKYEVLAREESFNQTAVESCFVLVE